MSTTNPDPSFRPRRDEQRVVDPLTGRDATGDYVAQTWSDHAREMEALLAAFEGEVPPADRAGRWAEFEEAIRDLQARAAQSLKRPWEAFRERFEGEIAEAKRRVLGE